ncbi:MAG: synthase, epsilon subunit [Acidimicrobiales bacterium]|jgi:F-type H+-transporting ATPase subunit epsilon|nr:synthase, epsilon subunit [Acidimicrobiales bacterium]
MALNVELVSPERILWSGEAEMVVARTTDGDIAFLTGHAPFIGALGIGAVVIEEPGGKQTKIAVHGGFVEVSQNRVTILSDVAELATDIDVARARKAKESAEAAFRAEPNPENDAALRRANLRLELAA